MKLVNQNNVTRYRLEPNKAFERYFQIEGDDLRMIYGKTRGAKKALKNFSASQKDNLLKIKD